MRMGSRLTFGELESSSRFSSTWFFTFHHSGVTGKKTFFFQGRSVLCVEFTQSPRDSHSDGFSLSFDSTTVNIDFCSGEEAVDHLTIDLYFFPSAIMSRSYVVGLEFFSSFEEDVELDLPVAQDIGIRRSASFIFGEHIIDNPVLVFSTKIYCLEWDAQSISHQHGIGTILRPRAFVGNGNSFVMPVLHKHANDFISLFDQQVSG